MEVRKICQWCGKPFIAQKTTTCYCSHQCSNLGYKERIRERKRQLKRAQELLQPRQAAEGQDFFSYTAEKIAEKYKVNAKWVWTYIITARSISMPSSLNQQISRCFFGSNPFTRCSFAKIYPIWLQINRVPPISVSILLCECP